jgi:hypothetical protein
MKINLCILLLLGITLFSCRKEKVNRRKLNGLYKVELFESTTYVNGHVDATTSTPNYGSIGLYDNGSGVFNEIMLDMPAPPSWALNHVSADLSWYADDAGNKVLTIFDGTGDDFVSYTLDKKGRNKYDWIFVISDTLNRLTYKEILHVRKVND